MGWSTSGAVVRPACLLQVVVRLVRRLCDAPSVALASRQGPVELLELGGNGTAVFAESLVARPVELKGGWVPR